MPRTVVRTTVTRSSTNYGDYTWLWSVIVALISLLFAIISIATSGWGGRSILKGCGNYCTGTIILAFLGMFSLLLGIIVTILFAKRLITSFSDTIRVSAVLLLALAGIFFVAAYMSYGTHNPNNYGYYLMVTSGVFAFVSSIIIAFWLGRNWGSV
jgi:uncharacterized membrane protein HdeD (DUF308 family)